MPSTPAGVVLHQLVEVIEAAGPFLNSQGHDLREHDAFSHAKMLLEGAGLSSPPSGASSDPTS